MTERFIKLVEYLPFIGMMSGAQTHVATRLVEAGIIGLIIMYGTVSILGERINHLAIGQADLRAEVMKIRNDFYRPIMP